MKESNKDKCFDESKIFRCNCDFKKWRFSAELLPKPGRTQSVLKDQKVNTMWVVSEEKKCITCKAIVT